jgi:phenylpropionate dioxygenase-like ring-hydroxylating dioxygenase large terminal subunit
MFLMNRWYVAAETQELTAQPLARTLCEQHVVMYRTEAGDPVALDDRCPHRYAPLSTGRCEGETIACGYHGVTFDPSGTCVLIPGQKNIPPRMRVRSYPIVDRWGWSWIWMGDPAIADPADIPDYNWLSSPDWQSFRRHYDIAAHYELCADNLLDLSHTPFIHQQTVGVREMYEVPVKTWVEGEKVYQQRSMTGVVPSPFVAEWGNFAGTIDRIATVEWVPAGNMAAALVYEDETNRITLRLTNPLTPETERTTHVWFAWSRDFGPTEEDHPAAVRFREQSYAVMAEDVEIMGIQQAAIDRGGEMKNPVPINADATLVEARKMLQKLLSEEQAQGQHRISA